MPCSNEIATSRRVPISGIASGLMAKSCIRIRPVVHELTVRAVMRRRVDVATIIAGRRPMAKTGARR